MHTLRKMAVLTAVLAAMAGAISPAWAIGGGGFAPGGPASGTVRPACNGYNMDGTINTSPGADMPGCIDHSDRSVNRAYAQPGTGIW